MVFKVIKQLILVTLILLAGFAVRAIAQTEQVEVEEADIKAVTADGRQILLKSDHTREIVTFKAGDPSTSAVLSVTKVWELQEACKLQFRLQNNLGYKIGAIVPRFTVQNAQGIVYVSPSISFNGILPTDDKYTEIQISGLGCHEISHMKLVDASKCRMGEIDMWNEEDGECLSHIYLEPSQEINISK